MVGQCSGHNGVSKSLKNIIIYIFAVRCEKITIFVKSNIVEICLYGIQ